MAKMTMVEFPVSDAPRSAQFLKDVFGWSHEAYGPTYVDVQIGGEQNFGLQQDQAEATGAPLVVIEVHDLAAARQAIEAAGGVVTVEPFDFPGGTRFQFREPGGNELAVWVPAAQ